LVLVLFFGSWVNSKSFSSGSPFAREAQLIVKTPKVSSLKKAGRIMVKVIVPLGVAVKLHTLEESNAHLNSKNIHSARHVYHRITIFFYDFCSKVLFVETICETDVVITLVSLRN
jgi:hypothetical protein